MLITDIWKAAMIEVLQMIYHNNLNTNKLTTLLDSYIIKALQTPRTLRLRNVYEGEEFDIDMNQIINFIKDKNLSIIANGSYTFSAEEILSDVTKYLIGELKGRKIEKELAKECELKGDIERAIMHDNLQTKIKANINSIFGIAGLPGSFFYSVDSASAITGQARQLTSEMAWAFEKLIANNTQLHTYNEAMIYFNNIRKKEKHYEQFKDYISYIPTKQDVWNKLLVNLTDTENYNKDTHNIELSLYWWFDHMSEIDRIYYFYTYNLKDFTSQNPKIIDLWRKIASTNEDFLNPYHIPMVLKSLILELYSVIKEFVVLTASTYDRMNKYGDHNNPKYHGAQRDAIVLSDTDSTFISYNNMKTMILRLLNIYNPSEELEYKIINTLTAISGFYCEECLDNFMKQTNTKPIFPDNPISMKNEYYYRTLAVFNGVKKNYVGLCLLREGNKVPEEKQIAYTGSKFTASKIPKLLKKMQTNLIEKYVLKAKTLDPINILKEMHNIENTIITSLKSGDKMFGMPVRYSGADNYKKTEQQVETNSGSSITIQNVSVQAYRLAELWNRLYPNDPILAGDMVMTYETTVIFEGQLDKIEDIEMREKIKECVFTEMWNGEYNILKRQGIKTIGIPRDGEIQKIPDWLLNIIDYKAMARKNMQGIVDFLPSLGLCLSRVSSTDMRYTNLVNF